MGTPIGIARPGRWETWGLAAAFVVCWSSGFVGAKLGGAHAAPTTLLMWRFVLVVALLFPIRLVARARSRRSAPPLTVRVVAWHALIGLLSQVGYLMTVYFAIELGVSTGTTALIDGVQPLVAAVAIGPLLGTSVAGRQWIGLVIGVAGVLVVTWADLSSPSSSAPAWAYAVPVLGMLSLIASTFVERRVDLQVPQLECLSIHCSVSALVFTFAALATGTASPPSAPGFWVAQVWLTLLATFGGYGLYWILVERIGVTPVNGLLFLIAPVTSIWGAVMFREPLTGVTVLGLVLTLCAAATIAPASASIVQGAPSFTDDRDEHGVASSRTAAVMRAGR